MDRVSWAASSRTSELGGAARAANLGARAAWRRAGARPGAICAQIHVSAPDEFDPPLTLAATGTAINHCAGGRAPTGSETR